MLYENSFDTGYESDIPENWKYPSRHVKNQITYFCANSGLPDSLVKTFIPFVDDSSCSDRYELNHRLTMTNPNRTNHLAPALFIKEIKNLKKLINECKKKVDSIRFVELLTLEYGIYAFNDEKKHLNYIKRSSGLFSLVLEVKIDNAKYKFAVNMHPDFSRNNDGYLDRGEVYGHLTKIKSELKNDPQLLLAEFVDFCRRNTKNV